MPKPRLRFLLLGTCLFLVGCSGASGTGKAAKTGPTRRAGEEALDSVRALLQAGTDRANSTLALQQANNFLGQNPDQRQPPLSPERRAFLQKRFGVDSGELEEIDNPAFTTLDAAYLEQCFLFRDAVRALDLDRLGPAEKAAALFDWTVRQVTVSGEEGEPSPPDYVLRRGRGTVLERALVFLASLHQAGLPGCLISSPGLKAPWACGVMVGEPGKGEILVFDHRLGIPLPGSKGSSTGVLARAFRLALPIAGPEDGTEIATLAGLRKQPGLLAALPTEDKTTYDVTAEMIKAARIEVAVPLSALASRHRALQDTYLPPTIQVRLAEDPEALLTALGAAMGVEGGVDGVTVAPRSPGFLRRFLPETEGGVDKTGRKGLFELSLVPVQSLPPQIQTLDGEPRIMILSRCINTFVSFSMHPRTPRDYLLRGRSKECSEALTVVLEEARVLQSMRQLSPEVEKGFESWKADVRVAYGEVMRAEEAVRRGTAGPSAISTARQGIEGAWKKHAKELGILLGASIAEPRRALATYLQALNMHEQAEHAQMRLEILTRGQPAPQPGEVEEMRKQTQAAWKEAVGWWENFVLEFSHLPLAQEARLPLARAQEAINNPGRTRTLLLDPRGVNPQERIARLYMAGRLPK